MSKNEPASSKLSKADMQEMIFQLEDAKRLLTAIGEELPHLHHEIGTARSLLTALIFSIEKPDHGYRRFQAKEPL